MSEHCTHCCSCHNKDTEVPSCAARVPIFRALPRSALVELGRAAHHRAYARGETVMQEGQPVSHLVIVAEGQLKLSRISAGGREQVVRTLGPGEFFGELSLFTPQKMAGDLIAVETTAACLIPGEAVQALLVNHAEVARALVQVLAERLAAAEELIADLGLRDVGQRLAAALLRAAAEQNSSSRVEVKVPWAEMAVRLGTTPESLSRRLKALSAQGIIHQQGRTVFITDPARLAQLAEGSAEP